MEYKGALSYLSKKLATDDDNSTEAGKQNINFNYKYNTNS